ncbi:heme o synthase [Marininema halotolerans]|nr:heme o synthase [Marininema halotolerans]
MNEVFTREGSNEKWIGLSSKTSIDKRWLDWLEVSKPRIMLSNVLACAVGFWAAGGSTVQQFPVFVATMIGMLMVISGSCMINNWIDQDIDPLMKRTQSRALVTGRLHPRKVMAIGTLLIMLGIGTLILFVNGWSAGLGALGSFLYIVIYSLWLKRVSTWNTVVGGFSGALPPLIGWIAATGTPDMGGWVIFLILFLWQPAHFFALAMVHVEDYAQAKIPMLPAMRGSTETKIQILFFVAFLLLASLLLNIVGAMNGIYVGISLFLGSVYLLLAIAGFFTRSEEKWSRLLFRYSLIYLVGMFIAFITCTQGAS